MNRDIRGKKERKRERKGEERSEKEGGILEELGLERGRDEPLSLVEELKRGTVTLRRVQPDFERKTVCAKMIF